MLKCVSAYTNEIDYPEIALGEIKMQLLDRIPLLNNTVGIIMCHPEFIASGVTEYICDKLPFDIAGVTTASQAVNDNAGEMILTLFMMTSDDTRFRTGVSDLTTGNINAAVKSAYEEASAGEDNPPKLALIFPPYIVNQLSGDAYVKAWDEIIPNTPVFGTIAADDTVEFRDCETIYNGKSSQKAMPFILCYGKINPRFLIATLPESSSLTLRGTVTKSKNNFVYEVNNIEARKFFKASGIDGSMIAVPWMLGSAESNNRDSVPVIRELFTYSEDDAAVFGGDVEEGSTILLLDFDSKSIKTTSKRQIEKINSLQDVNGALLFSCTSRRFVLFGVNDDFAELQIANDTIRQDIPFMLGYSGGEICPVIDDSGIINNRFHNYSMAILVV